MQRHPLSGGVLFSHWSDTLDQDWPWHNFSREELACRHCGELYWHLPSFDAIQRAREECGHPFRVNSAHRCRIWNAIVGGRPRSAHLFVAFDISTVGFDAVAMYHALLRWGLASIGGYATFLHADGRPDGRRWYGSERSRRIWAPRFQATPTVML